MSVPKLEEVINKIENSIRIVEEELGVAQAVTLIEGVVTCDDCLRIEVCDEDSFIKALAALVKQGLATGSLPIIVAKKVSSSELRYVAVNTVDRVMLSLSMEIKY